MRAWRKIRSWFGRREDTALAEEMRGHREMIEERYVAEGMPPEHARAMAARQFGPAALALEDSRAEWSWTWLESVWMDARYAVRALRRSKTYAFTAVLTLATGLGIAATGFTLFNAYVLRPFAVRDPYRLFELDRIGVARNSIQNRVNWREYDDLAARSDVFAGVIATRNFAKRGGERYWRGVLVSGNYFEVLGARLALGRPILEDDARHWGAGNVAVISHEAWVSVFRGDPAAIGRKIELRGLMFEVIGVAAPEFSGLEDSPPDLWVPITMNAALHPGPLAVNAIGRLRPEVTPAAAEGALGALAERHDPGTRYQLAPRSTVLVPTKKMLIVFLPVVLALGLVLGTCCANAANMMLARAISRRREIGVRLAMGAGRGRLTRQLLAEAAVIAGLAGLLGMVLARACLELGQRAFLATVTAEVAGMVRLQPLEIDHRVFLITLAVAGLAAFASALPAVLGSAATDITASIRGESGSGRPSRPRDALVAIQVGACAVLLVTGALLYRRAESFQAVDTGLRSRAVIDVNPSAKHAEVAAFLADSPGVEAVALSSRMPWYGRLRTISVTPSGHAAPATASYNIVSAGYFRVFGIQARQGRLFTAEESRAGVAVAVVSAATARTFWPGQDPIGKEIRFEPPGNRESDDLTQYPALRVIGVAGDVAHGMVFDGLDATCIYVPPRPQDTRARNVAVAMKEASPRSAETVRRLVVSRFPSVEAETMPMSSILHLQIYPFRAASALGWFLGITAMVLSISGMHGVISYLVQQRSKEVGIRVALGATAANVVALMMRRGFVLAAIGAGAGACFAAAAIRLLIWWSASMSVTLLDWDHQALVTGAGLAWIAALAAAFGPAARAARLDPNTVLRAD